MGSGYLSALPPAAPPVPELLLGSDRILFLLCLPAYCRCSINALECMGIADRAQTSLRRALRVCQLSLACGNMRDPDTRWFKARGLLGLGLNHMTLVFPLQIGLLVPVELGWIWWKEPKSGNSWVPALLLP